MKTILIIEDNPDMRENTAEILELARYNVITAVNGKEGVRLAQSEIPDLIVCDIMMPELDGYGVLHMLGKDTATAGIPFVFLSAKAEKTDLRKGMSLGADDYLTKPFETTDLLNVVEMRLKKNEILRTEFPRNAEGLSKFYQEAKGNDLLKELSENREERTYGKKAEIYSEGSHPRGIFLVTEGKVKTVKANDAGKEYVTGLYKEGDFLGYTALIEEQPYSDAAIVTEQARAVLIPKEDFFALLYGNRDVANKFIKMLSGNLAEMENRLIRLAYNSVRKRVSEALLMLQKHFAGDNQAGIPVSREDLAGIVGTATETVVRTLSDFKDEGLIAVKGSNILIIEPEKLAMMKN